VPRGPRSKLKRSFNLGIEQAEVDPLLSDAFYESGDYEVISSRDDPRCFLIARTGGGKSAALQRLEETNADHVVRISPDNLSLPYITNLGVMKYLDTLQVRLDPFFIALWKHVLLVEVLRHRYKIDSAVAKQTFLMTIKEKVSRDPAKRQALEYLEEFHDRFWCETDERVREIVEKFEEKVSVESKGQLALPGLAQAGLGESTTTTDQSEERIELVARFQRIVNETQLPRLNKMIEVLEQDILDRQNFTFVIIDDLDRDWVDERVMNSLIRCLFRAVQDLKRVRNLKIIVALRTNIFQELEYAERFGQEEKLRSLVLDMRWSTGQLHTMLDERVRTAARRFGQESVATVQDLLPATNRTRGSALDYIMGRTLRRPRDAISFVNECLNVAVGKNSISWDAIHEAEHPYSEKRLLALRDEWKSTYPDINRVFDAFLGAPSPMSRSEFTDVTFKGGQWLTHLCESLWDYTVDPSNWLQQYQPLLKVLYQIGLVGSSTSEAAPTSYFYESPAYVDRPGNLGDDAWFDVHPTFHLALEITPRSN
jgi:hypothetical protein